MEGFDHKKIEKKWRDTWKKSGLYKSADSVKGKDNFYLLTEFPYPSGNLHVGHWYAFAVPDILARYHRMNGKNVLYPIGFDAFGLPAENAAIKNKINPRKWTYDNIAHMRKQIESMGASFDWSREVITADPEYYKWTQWQFLQLYKKGLVYQKETAVNWCPKDKTVLANEQVIDGRCERCDSVVEQKMMLQWNIKITDYADRLIDDLEKLNWPEEIKQSQCNWIGRSEGAEIDFPLKFTGRANIDNNYVLLHGKGGSSQSDFFPWLKEQLERRGYRVQVPDLPNSSEPNDDEQADFVEKNCHIDAKTIIIGHSFGGIVAMRLLERGHKLAGLSLISTPFSGNYLDGKKRETVTRALKKGIDFKRIRKNVENGRIVLLYDTHDQVVPMSDGEELAEKLEAPLFKQKAEKSHFNGTVEHEIIKYVDPTMTVFTTRPDTLFGATYLVLSPEHPWMKLAFSHKGLFSNEKEIVAYIKNASQKSELERMTDQKEKTGVRLEGVEAINPATGEKIPIYVADYVLSTYGTGAIMAVPAHDERDREFAKKFNIPIKEVIEPAFMAKDAGREDAVKDGMPFVRREAICAVVRNPKDDTYLSISWKGVHMHGLVTGGIDEGEDVVETARREILEETGYKNLHLVEDPKWTINTFFYHRVKKQNRHAHFHFVFFELENDERDAVDEKEGSLHEVMWIKKNKLKEFFTVFEGDFMAMLINDSEYVYAGQGLLINSGKFDGLKSAEARIKMTEAFGRKKTTYKLRDWIVSRQRYWGVPIPIIHCEECGAQPVSDEQLPVLLPDVDDYLPEGSGKSPLAKVDTFINVSCPKCGGAGERETDTLDTFVDSSWYFLRYTDPKNETEFASASKMKHWMPVDLYSGGAEHTTMHLLYSRFWHKALFDLGLVADPEPYTKRMNRSLILGPDGHKMSKSRGNVVDPDEVVERLGADTVRMYLAFIGPYNEVSSYPWNPDGAVGIRRFLERVFRVRNLVQGSEVPEISTVLHKTIKKVGEDITMMKFNTAISQLMILLNHIEKIKKIGATQWNIFIKLLEPFAPYVAEELWSQAGHTTPLVDEGWPQFDEKQLHEDSIMIAVQINGKTRGEVSVPVDADKATMEEAARGAVAARIADKKILKTIVVPNRLVNFVLEGDAN